MIDPREAELIIENFKKHLHGQFVKYNRRRKIKKILNIK